MMVGKPAARVTEQSGEAKNLKAVSIRGTQGVTVADPDTLLKMSFDITEAAQGKNTEKYRNLRDVHQRHEHE